MTTRDRRAGLAALAVLALCMAVWMLALPDASSAAHAALDRTVAWVFAQQRAFHRELTQHLHRLGQGEGSAWTLIAASFTYGVFHAAGPGHGKAVITAYLLTHRSRWATGAALSVGAALCQAMTAIALVHGLLLAANRLTVATQDAVLWSQRVSDGLLAAIGGILAWRAACALRRVTAPLCTCGDRIPPPAGGSLRTRAALIVSIGLRPCTGAILVLVFANSLNLGWAGIASALAMAAGTAITVTTLASLAIKIRTMSFLSDEAETAPLWRSVAAGAALLGGLAIFLLGASMVFASFAPQHPLGMS